MEGSMISEKKGFKIEDAIYNSLRLIPYLPVHHEKKKKEK